MLGPDDWKVIFRTLRERRGWTQEQVALALADRGVRLTDTSTVAQYERRGTGRYQVITAYRDLFGADFDALVEESGAAPAGVIA